MTIQIVLYLICQRYKFESESQPPQRAAFRLGLFGRLYTRAAGGLRDDDSRPLRGRPGILRRKI